MVCSVTRFCSNNCKSAWRRATGIDNIEAKCVICGETYTKNRYSKGRTCSRACRRKLASGAASPDVEG